MHPISLLSACLVFVASPVLAFPNLQKILFSKDTIADVQVSEKRLPILAIWNLESPVRRAYSGSTIYSLSTNPKVPPVSTGVETPHQVITVGSKLWVLNSSTLDCWDSETSSPKRIHSLPNDGFTRFAIAPKTGRLVLWKPGNNSAVFYMNSQAKAIPMKNDESKLAGMSLSSNGRLLAVAHTSGSVQIGNLRSDGSFDFKASKRLPRKEFVPLTFSSTSRLLAVGNGGRLVILDVNNAQVYRAFERKFDDGDISCIKFSSDDSMIAVGSMGENPSVRVWNLRTGELINEFMGHRRTISVMAFNVAGTEIAAGSVDGRVLIWKLEPARVDAHSRLNFVEAWTQIDNPDTKLAHQAMADLEYGVQQLPTAMRTLQTKMLDIEQELIELNKIMLKLDHDEFRTREYAQQILLKSGFRTLQVLQAPNRKKLGTEGEERIQSIIALLEKSGFVKPESDLFGDQLRLLRSLQILESSNKPESVKVLRELKDRYPKQRIAKDAEAILEVFSNP